VSTRDFGFWDRIPQFLMLHPWLPYQFNLFFELTSGKEKIKTTREMGWKEQVSE